MAVFTYHATLSASTPDRRQRSLLQDFPRSKSDIAVYDHLSLICQYLNRSDRKKKLISPVDIHGSFSEDACSDTASRDYKHDAGLKGAVHCESERFNGAGYLITVVETSLLTLTVVRDDNAANRRSADEVIAQVRVRFARLVREASAPNNEGTLNEN